MLVLGGGTAVVLDVVLEGRVGFVVGFIEVLIVVEDGFLEGVGFGVLIILVLGVVFGTGLRVVLGRIVVVVVL